jgi:hypothetical protein
MKKILCIVFSCILLLSFTSCAIIDRLKGDMSRIGHDWDGNLLYNGNTYYLMGSRFVVRSNKNDQVFDLGWYSQFPFFPDMHFYAFDEEAPLFIFCDNSNFGSYVLGLCVRSDYDIYNEVFTVDNTDIEISLSDAMTKSDVEVTDIKHEEHTFLTMLLKDDPRIQVELQGPYRHNDKWYFRWSGEAWLISDDLASMLKDNNIISE